jgi:hypothetical protein
MLNGRTIKKTLATAISDSQGSIFGVGQCTPLDLARHRPLKNGIATPKATNIDVFARHPSDL